MKTLNLLARLIGVKLVTYVSARHARAYACALRRGELSRLPQLRQAWSAYEGR